MRIYNDPMETIREVERDLFEMGTRYRSVTVQDQDVADDPRFETIELFGYSYTMKIGEGDPVAALEDMIRYVDADPTGIEWAQLEFNERVGDHCLSERSASLINPGLAWKQRKEFWGRFIRDGFFSYSYAERWRWQLPYVIAELSRRPTTRQAMMTMYNAHQDMLNWGGRDRVPCSVSYQFAIRDDRLNLVYNQRSCDFLKFFAYDVYFTVRLLLWVAEKINVLPGAFVHFLGSIHAFKGDLDDRGIF